MTQQRTQQKRLRVSVAAAHRLRERVLLHDTISKADVKMLLTIIDDVYPQPHARAPVLWPLLLGMALGVGTLIVLLLLW